MKKANWLLLLILPLMSMAQDKGIQFEKGLGWEQVKEKAKAENKYIFVDCFATWCAPCKYMDQQVFSQKEVGDYFNGRFINVKVQMDQTATDAPEVRALYATARELEKNYYINSYPTYLFFDPEGKVVHRTSGAFEAKSFLDQSKDALIPEKQSYSLMEHWKEHLSDSTFLFNAYRKAKSNLDEKNAKPIGDAYLASIKNYLNRDAIIVLSERISSSKDPGFDLFINNQDKVETAMQQKHGALNRLIGTIIYKEDVKQTLRQQDWRSIKNSLQQKYPMLQLWKADDVDSAFLTFVLLPAKNAKDTSNIKIIGNAYLDHVKNLFLTNNIREVISLENIEESTQTKYFQFALQNAAYIDSLVKNKTYPAELKGDNYAETMLGKIIFREEVEPIFAKNSIPYNIESIITSVSSRYPTLDKNALKEALRNNVGRRINKELDAITKMKEPDEKDWEAISKQLQTKYVKYDYEKTLLNYQILYYHKKKANDMSGKYTLALIKHDKKITDEWIDNYCSINIFLYVDDKSMLEKACSYMKPVARRNPGNEMYLDDYANLLYKAGHTEEAMRWEKKAIDCSSKKNDGHADLEMASNLEKMKAGLPTWKD